MSYLSGDGHFYLHRADTDIDNINEDIQCLSETASRIPGPELTPGDYCVAKYTADNTWCRARILQYVPGTDTVDVLFVDYGNEEQIALQSIRQLNPKLSFHPAQSIKCELYGAKSWQGDLWSEKAIEKFADVCGNVELVALTISHSDNMCVVELYNSGGDGQSINELMVRQGLLKPTAEKLLRLVPEKTDKTTGNGEMTETEEHQDRELPAVTPPLGKPGPLQFPDERYWDVYVSFLTSIKDITFRLVGENYSVKLEELEVSLKDCYSSAAVTSGEEIVEGSVCVASVDGLYHRVRVLNREGNKAKCFFLDHGDTDEMDIQNLRLISADFNTLPYQACHCELHGLELTSEALTALALETLLNYVLGKTCVAEVVTSYGRHHSVVLFDTSGEEDVNINDAIAKLTAEENTKCVQFVKSGGYLLMGPYDIPTPCDDQLSVTSESSSISSSGRQEVVIVKPKFLKYQMNRESAFNDAESVSSECSSTSEMSITLKPKFHTKSTTNQSARNPNASADSNLLAIGDLQLSESGDSANFSDVASSSTMSSLDTSLGQPCSIEPAMLQQFSQGINQESIVGTTLSPGMSQGKSRPSTTEDRSDVHPEDMPLPESCSDFSSASDLDQGLSLGSGMPGISSWDGKTSDIHRKVSTTKSQTPVNAATSYAPQGAWSFPADMDIWGKEYLSLPLPPFLQPPPVGQYMDVRVRWASDPENFVARTPRMEEIQAGHLYAGRQCGTWYRVIVKDFLQDTDLVCILMADIGEFDVMSLSDLHPLPLQFWRIPFQAIRAKLHGVTCAASKSWSEATKFKFLELVLDKDLVAMVQAKDDSAGVVSLDLVDTSQENQDICINDIFISKLLSWTDS
ncbi:uncharacterized protein LOC135464225 isoform X2 [Liolophura sinensis]|uniref:uncharacterized protein LOC135464225 isoform X2 n=1 Tax=Liolophura sinensis TaxID=3198878 RepID=UPI0031589F4C